MTSFARILLPIGLGLLPSLADAQTIVPIGGTFGAPQHITTDTAGNVFVADADANVVREILADGGYLTTRIFGNGMGPVQDVALDGQGNIFVIDPTDKTVKELLAASGYTTIQPIGSAFFAPNGIVVDGSGNVFVSEGDTITEFLAAGGYAKGQYVGLNVTGGGVGGFAIDGSGNLYVSNTSGQIVEVQAAGGYQTGETLGYGFSNVTGIAVDGSGNVFVAETYSTTIEEIPAAAGPVPTVKAIGSGFVNPTGVAVDADGNVFVTDQGNSAVKELLAAGGYATVTTLAGGFNHPTGLAFGPGGNLFVADTGSDAIKELTAAGNYTTAAIVTYGFNGPTAVAVDSQENIFVSDTGNSAIKELPAATGYTTTVTVGSGFAYQTAIALDSSDNVYVADGDTVSEVLAAGGYSTVKSLATLSDTANGVAVDGQGNVFVAIGAIDFLERIPPIEAVQEILAVDGSIPPSPTIVTLSGDFGLPSDVALDASGNVYVTDGTTVSKILAAGGYTTVTALATGFNDLGGIAVAGNGAIFVSDTGNKTVDEIFLTAPTPLFAAVLPDSRSVQVGTTATIFASLINSGTDTLNNCRIALDGLIPAGLTLDYQTTDPTTNSLTGSPDTPVSIPGNDGSQTFVLSFTGTAAFNTPSMPLNFTCDGVTSASVIPGIDTVDLSMSDTPVADVIALAATVSNNGIVELPQNGTAAFAVATTNLGATDMITVAADTGTTALPVTVTICQSDPSNGACLSAPTPTVTLSDAAGTTPTFSVFVTETGSGTIAFSPAHARVFVRFKDADGTLHGATSVAVETTN